MAGEPFLSNTHFALFGRIVSAYARVEAGQRHLLATLLNLPLELVLVLCSPYTTRHCRNVCRSIGKIVLHDEPALLAEMVGILGDHKSLDRLRNDVAHNMWSRSPVPGSIRPWHVDVSDGKAMFSGFNAKSRDYSIADLEAAADLAVRLNGRLIRLVDSPSLAAAMAKKTDLTRLDIDAILGISSSPPSSPPPSTQETKA